MSRDALNAEDLQRFQPIKMKECEVDFEGRRDAVAKRGMQWKQKQSQDFCYDCENFAGIAKISQS